MEIFKMKYKLFVSIILFFIVNANCQNIDQGLVVNYEFNGNFDDTTDNNFHAENQGAFLVEDRNGNPNSAVYFNGISSYIDLPNEEELKPQMPFSISFWVKYASSSFDDQEVFELSYEENRNSGVYLNSQISTGKLAINIANGLYNYVSHARRSYVSNNVIEIDEWLNVAVIVNNSNNMEIHYDCKNLGGQFSGSANTLVYSDTNGVIGKRQRNLNSSPNYFNGYVDDFKIWDRALSEYEISFLCNNTLTTNQTVEPLQTVTIYPNPSNGLLQIKTNIDFDKIEVYNQIGIKVLSKKYSQEIKLSHLNSGIYFIKFINDNLFDMQKVILN
jgi:hypothetical protein